VDVARVVVIDRHRDVVPIFAADTDNATRWYQNLKAVEWETPRPAARGIPDRLRGAVPRPAHRLHPRDPHARDRVRCSSCAPTGPFPMVTTYRGDDDPSGGTRMTLLNSGEPTGLLPHGDPEHEPREADVATLGRRRSTPA
jgi:hypothetical protein